MHPALAQQSFCYLTTTGRRTGKPHRIEIWFATADDGRETIFILAGGGLRSDWVRNLVAHPSCRVEIGAEVYQGVGSVIDSSDADDETARRLVYDKYRHDDDLEDWRNEALPVAIDLRQFGEIAVTASG